MQRGFYKILLVSVLFLTAFVAGVLYIEKNQKLPSFVQSSPSPQPSPTPIDISNWKTYSDIYVRMSIKHPSSWVEGKGPIKGSSCLVDPGKNKAVDGIDDTLVCFTSQSFKSSPDLRKAISSFLESKYGTQLARQSEVKKIINGYTVWYTEFDLEQNGQLNQNTWAFFKDKNQPNRYVLISLEPNVYAQVITPEQHEVFDLMLDTVKLNP